MIKKILIVILILLVIGLYFQTELTKKAMKITGRAGLDVTKKAFEEIKESEELKEIKDELIDNLSEKINKTMNKK